MTLREQWRTAPSMLRIASILLPVAAVALLAPQWRIFMLSPFPVMLAAAAIGALAHRRASDALALAVPILLAEWAEPMAGSRMMACLVLPVYALTRRPRFAAVTGAVALGLLVLAIELKDRFAGTPLTWHDIRYFFMQFRDNVGVMVTQPTLLLQAGVAFLAAGTLAAVAWWWDGRRRLAAPRGSVLAALALCVLTAGWSGWELGTAALRERDRGAWVMGQRQVVRAAPLTMFLATAAMPLKWMPPRVDTRDFAAAVQARRGTVAAQRPADIMVVLQESQFNPASLSDCPPQLCDLPVFGHGASSLAWGPLQVQVFGGGTWLSEFALVSGVPHTAFGRAGEFAPFSVAPSVRRSLPRSLKAAGYRTVAVYPVGGGMMNARSAYAAYGFDKFYDAADLGLNGSFDTPDAVMHEAALKVLRKEREQGQPVFLFLVTICNHGDHGTATRMAPVPGPLLEAVRPHFPEGREADNVADYLWRTRQFEKAVGATSRALLESETPVVFAWFGDHQPPFGNALGLRKRIQSLGHGPRAVPARFQTWYHVAANAPRQPAAAASQPLDIVFLPGLLAQAAGVPLDDLLAANVTARVLCDGLLQQCREPGVAEAYLDYVGHELKAFELP